MGNKHRGWERTIKSEYCERRGSFTVRLCDST